MGLNGVLSDDILIISDYWRLVVLSYECRMKSAAFNYPFYLLSYSVEPFSHY